MDPRLEIMRQEAGKPTCRDTACDALVRGGEALASLTPHISTGEARVVLSLLVQEWEHKPPDDYQEKVALWVSKKSEAEKAQADDIDGELQTHLHAQASGAYALAPWPWPVLTEQSRSLMPGSVTLICGSPGASKSWFALSCLRYWIASNISASVLMLEETRKWHMQRALAQCSANTDLLRPEWIAEHRDEALAIFEKHRDELALIRSRLECDGDWTMAKCAEWVERQCKARHRIIVVDPISLADPGSERTWDADRKFMARAKVAVEKAGASLVLVTHPRKAQGKDKGGMPQLDDLAGGAAYGRACASAIWISGVDGTMTASVIGADGAYSQCQIHKTARILKARNSTGGNKVIGFQFRNLAFDEMGVIAGEKDQPESRITRAGADRARKLRQKPSPDEDQF